MYKRIAGAESQPNSPTFGLNCKTATATPPESVLNLLAAGEIRLRCEQLGISQLDRKRTQIELPATKSSGPQHTMLMRHGSRPVAQKTFIEMLHIRFGAEAADTSQQESAAHSTVDPAAMMKLVARNAKRGAAFTPQGVLRWPLTSAKSDDVLAETRALLESLQQPA